MTLTKTIILGFIAGATIVLGLPIGSHEGTGA
jgi:hypothetical protein